jgi:hypothetical protein
LVGIILVPLFEDAEHGAGVNIANSVSANLRKDVLFEGRKELFAVFGVAPLLLMLIKVSLRRFLEGNGLGCRQRLGRLIGLLLLQ